MHHQGCLIYYFVRPHTTALCYLCVRLCFVQALTELLQMVCYFTRMVLCLCMVVRLHALFRFILFNVTLIISSSL